MADPDRRFAFLGVRACELHAIAIQDRIFLHGCMPTRITAPREGSVLIAVNCGKAGGACFCVRSRPGPRATQGFDLALTELSNNGCNLMHRRRIDRLLDPEPATIQDHRQIAIQWKFPQG